MKEEEFLFLILLRKKFVFVERRNKFLGGKRKKFVCEERLNSYVKKD